MINAVPNKEVKEIIKAPIKPTLRATTTVASTNTTALKSVYNALEEICGTQFSAIDIQICIRSFRTIVRVEDAQL